MSESNAPIEQIQLRVKTGSRLDDVMALLRNGDYVSKDDVIKAAGVKDIWWLLHAMSGWYDNLAIDFPHGKATVKATYVAPRTRTTVQHIHEAKFDGAANVAPQSNDEVGEVIWPDAPPLLDGIDNFDPPEYYNLLSKIVDSGRNVSLSGPPGIGKSTSVEQYAAESHKVLVNISCEGGLSKRDLVGSPEIVNGTSKFMVAEYAAAVVNGWWAKIDEVNAADADALLFINSQLAPPNIVNIHGKQYKVHPDFRLFITYNRNLAGTKPLPPAFKDRFFPIYLEFPSAYRLRRLLERNGLPSCPQPPEIYVGWPDKVVEFGTAMWAAHSNGQMRYQISPRRLMDAAFLMVSGACADVVDALDKAVLATIDSNLERRVAKEVLEAMK